MILVDQKTTGRMWNSGALFYKGGDLMVRVTWNFVRGRQKLIQIGEIIITEVALIEQHTGK